MKSTDNKRNTLSDPEIISLYFDRDESAIEETVTINNYGLAIQLHL